MQKNLIVVAIGVLAFCTTVSAQKINTDSLKLVSNISNYQLKLGQLQNTVTQKTTAKDDANLQAQRSADDNRTAANNLSDDAEDKKLARQADNSASTAKGDAKKARKASERLKNLNKDIQDLKDKIAKDQQKLDMYTKFVTVSSVLVQTDTTQ